MELFAVMIEDSNTARWMDSAWVEECSAKERSTELNRTFQDRSLRQHKAWVSRIKVQDATLGTAPKAEEPKP